MEESKYGHLSRKPKITTLAVMIIITQLLEKKSKIKLSSNQLRHVETIKRCSNFFSFFLQVREGYMDIRMRWQI